MKKLIFLLFGMLVLASSCELMMARHIHGDGKIITETRKVSFADKIKLAGSYDIELVKGSIPGVVVEADENLLPYLKTRTEGDWLVIKTDNFISLDPSKKIKITITTENLRAISIAGSGNVFGTDKMSCSDKMDLRIAGSGDVNLNINAPKVFTEIAGSGNVTLAGETKDQEIRIAGNGDYLCQGLKSENADVHIAGSGDVRLFVDNKLNIRIAGSGDVYYQGNATVEQHIAGNGQIKKIQ
jgi:hypothetical protein